MVKITRLILAFAIIFLSVPFQSAHAFQDALFNKIKNSEEPVVVKGDRVEYFHEQNKVVGEGNVSITYGDVKLTCDKITVYTDTKEAICDGNVKITQPQASMEGERMNYNFSTKRGSSLDSKIKAKPFYGAAKKVEQPGDEEFDLDRGYITTCDREHPHYRIQAKEIKVYFGKKIIAKHILFFVGNVPILYLPIYIQPLGGKYPDVTIVPGRTSDWGYYVLTAWRYYLNENSKGFVHLDYREKKGFGEGIDYSYDAKELGTGVFRAYYAHENDVFAINKSGKVDDRWRLQYRNSIVLPEDTTLTTEFNKLSDENMIKDYLYREYEENPIPENYLLIQTAKPNYTFTFLTELRLNDFYTVSQRLPEAKIQVNNQRLWGTNFYYRSENSATYFVKEYNENYVQDPPAAEKAFRSDNYQRLSYAAKLFKFLNVTPFIATRQTYYSQNRWKVDSQLRSIYEEGVDVSTKVHRTFDVQSNFLGMDINNLRHIVTPSAGFLARHAPTIDSSNLFQFDAVDGIQKYNGFTLSLENKLQTKVPSGDGMKTVDLARLIVSTDYLFRLEKQSIKPQGDGKFGDLYLQLDLKPYEWLFIDGDMTLDHKTHDVNSANIDAYFDFGEKCALGIGHRYEHTDDSETSQLTGSLHYNINNDWKIRVYERYDFASQKWEEQEYTVLKDLHCWVAEVTISVRDSNVSGWLVFRLKAFPEIPIGLFKTTYHRPTPGGRY